MNPPAWTADIAIDAALAAQLVRSQFPALACTPIELLGNGWDNVAYLLDERVVFRFPRRRIAAPLIEREIAMLPGIASHVPLPISAPTYAGAPSEAYPWPFAGYDRIAGSTACSVTFSHAARAALAAPLGRFLRALHALDPAAFVARGLPPDEIGRLDHDKRLRATRERLPALAAAGLVRAPERIAGWLDAHPPATVPNGDRCIVHGDLYARHLLVDGGRVPTGVIDWGDVHLGDPALDIAIAHLMLPATAHAAFRDAYGPVDERTWLTARYRAVYHAVLELDYGVRANDNGMRAAGATALELMSEAWDERASEVD